MWTIQWSEIEISMGSSTMKQYHDIRIDPFFQYLPYRVSKWCLKKILDIYSTIGSDTYEHLHPDICGCPVWTTHGIPCAHQMALWKGQGVSLPLASIDVQWRQLDLNEDVRGTDPNDRRTFIDREFRGFAWNEYPNMTNAQAKQIRTVIHEVMAPELFTTVEVIGHTYLFYLFFIKFQLLNWKIVNSHVGS